VLNAVVNIKKPKKEQWLTENRRSPELISLLKEVVKISNK
jgi:hypothetical protein